MPRGDAVTRNRIVSALGRVRYDRFLVYLMGPYKSFNLSYVLSEDELAEIDVETLPSPLRRLFRNKDEITAAKRLLRRVQGSLRVDPGLNAFLATDVGISTDEIDAATQSVEYARRSNVTAFVVPYLGHNLGVGIEVGSVLQELADTVGERVAFLHEDDVSSEMIRSAASRWDFHVDTYRDEAELVERLRLFAIDIMNRELYGDLDPLG